MSTVIVQSVDVGSNQRSEPVTLGPGEAITFGRGAPGLEIGVVLDHPEVARVAGEITAVDDHWTISNFSHGRTYVVENPEGGGEHVKISPRRLGAAIPFELSRIVLPVSAGQVEIMVFAPEHTYADPLALTSPDGQLTASSFSLDERAKYFVILVALCEPQLRNSSSSALPTATEIITRLAPLPAFHSLTRTAVNFHIDYWAQNKLRLREFAETSRATRVEYKRAALVGFAIRFDLVREEHLGLLPRGGPV